MHEAIDTVLDYRATASGSVTVGDIELSERDVRQYGSIAYALRAILAVEQDNLLNLASPFLPTEPSAIDALKGLIDVQSLAALYIADSNARVFNESEISAARFAEAWNQLIGPLVPITEIPQPAVATQMERFPVLERIIEHKVASYDAYNDVSMTLFWQNNKSYFARLGAPSDEASASAFRTFATTVVLFIVDLLRRSETEAVRSGEAFIRAPLFEAAQHLEAPFVVNEYEDVVFIHSYDAHSDYRSLPELESPFVRPYAGLADGTTSQMMAFRNGDVRLTLDDAPHLIDLYDAGISQMDDEVGRLVTYLKETETWNDTLFVLTSDHGEEFLEHDGVLHGKTQYQEVQRIPLLVHGPGLVPARVEAPASLIDVMPTLLDLLGVSATESMDGLSLRTAWREDSAALPDRFLFAEADHNNTIHDVTRSVRYKGFKLRFNRDTGEAVLHDLSSDPGELEDASANFVSGREQLMKELVAFMEKPERETPTITLTPEELERLKSLGYIQ